MWVFWIIIDSLFFFGGGSHFWSQLSPPFGALEERRYVLHDGGENKILSLHEKVKNNNTEWPTDD